MIESMGHCLETGKLFAGRGVELLRSLCVRLVDLLRRAISAFEITANLATLLMAEVNRLRRAQPVDITSSTRPDFFPHGIKIILISLLVTYLTIR